jgi:hypothetical protein
MYGFGMVLVWFFFVRNGCEWGGAGCCAATSQHMYRRRVEAVGIHTSYDRDRTILSFWRSAAHDSGVIIYSRQAKFSFLSSLLLSDQ